MSSIQPLLPPLKKEGGWVGMSGELHFTAAVISKNTWFTDYCTKAVCVENVGMTMRPPPLTPATLQLSFNLLRKDLSKWKLGAHSLNCLVTPRQCRIQLWSQMLACEPKLYHYKQYHPGSKQHHPLFKWKKQPAKRTALLLSYSLVYNWWLNLVNYSK